MDAQNSEQQNVDVTNPDSQNSAPQDTNPQNADAYDQKLEDLKIDLKNKLLVDWQICTWLVDGQATKLCKDVYEKAYTTAFTPYRVCPIGAHVALHFISVSKTRKPLKIQA